RTARHRDQVPLPPDVQQLRFQQTPRGLHRGRRGMNATPPSRARRTRIRIRPCVARPARHAAGPVILPPSQPRFMPSRASSDRSSAAMVFRHDAKDGSIRLPDERRIVALSETLVQQLHFAIIEQRGETAQDALYRTGYEWAL